MALHYTKSELYNKVHQYKDYLGFNTDEFGLDLVPYCKEFGFLIGAASFNTKGLRGMATVSTDGYSDAIVLNSNRGYLEQNFDCGHEMIHLGIHRDLKQKYFRCMDKFYSNRDGYVEWQANEGAAELLIPYEVFISLIGTYDFKSYRDIRLFKEYACSLFNVSNMVIEYRLEGLKYEIHQYLNGTPMKDIQILSISRQQEKKINVKSINALEYDFYIKETDSWNSSSHFINFESL